jgi:glucose-6-phosphate 1-dehydrogenase
MVMTWPRVPFAVSTTRLLPDRRATSVFISMDRPPAVTFSSRTSLRRAGVKLKLLPDARVTVTTCRLSGSLVLAVKSSLSPLRRRMSFFVAADREPLR